MFFNTIVTALAAASCVAAAPTQKLNARASVPHDSLNPWPEAVRTGTEGDGIKRFEPTLHIAHGCQPYTAVNEAGDISGGLQDTGSSTGGCRDTGKGQTYVRAKWHNGRFAIMYSWYFPKDHPNSGDVAGGHRHDWENVVVFIDDPAAATPTLIGASASSHSGYTKSDNPQRNGDRVMVEYFTNFPTNHELQFKTSEGADYALLDWDVMTDAAKQALQNADFGSANVPFKDGNFETKIEEAWV
ncbi:putative necrosis- and ethylene-inducing protein 1 precursor protein [Neofusicoccum parvum]|uniref:Necrosis- and ethylene-inducing protein 1 protein n=2 Tax=Neofusicoccum parvum TaxID=310453 RepID=A0ACB5SNQ9_9PEZI|nr:putative necrosis- and ethylene-inducing protein 1 precursor protein [Neofusicoccum parvum UCRNP2]GME33883.1 putative necrosis- and ethylene-inducing protein 1 precursor protein [Neofusicoccum parvum]GME48613.1 putative necrosis- and ethylene-inducing protein 1 precursor protein [Neofusicoccum parvum]